MDMRFAPCDCNAHAQGILDINPLPSSLDFRNALSFTQWSSTTYQSQLDAPMIQSFPTLKHEREPSVFKEEDQHAVEERYHSDLVTIFRSTGLFSLHLLQTSLDIKSTRYKSQGSHSVDSLKFLVIFEIKVMGRPKGSINHSKPRKLEGSKFGL